jgi:hypothetical protein
LKRNESTTEIGNHLHNYRKNDNHIGIAPTFAAAAAKGTTTFIQFLSNVLLLFLRLFP